MERKKQATIGSIVIGIIVFSAILGFAFFPPDDTEPKLFVAIHCEPGSFPQTTDYPQQYWLNLRDMMIEANQYDVKLTLLFNPQWASFILDDSIRLDMVRQWESNGHEIGLHHHGAHMNSWNGYTDQIDYQTDPKYIGSIDDMMTLMNQLPVSGQISVGCVANDDDIDHDFPIDIPYRTYGGSEKLEHLWSDPESDTYNEHSVIGVTHARFGVISTNVNIDLDEFKGYIAEERTETAMGLIWHVFNYADGSEPFTSLFEYLSEEGIATWTVSSIIESS